MIRNTITAVSIRVEVTAQADYVISILDQVKLFVPGASLWYAVLECHWNTQLKSWLQCRGILSSGIRAKQ